MGSRPLAFAGEDKEMKTDREVALKSEVKTTIKIIEDLETIRRELLK